MNKLLLFSLCLFFSCNSTDKSSFLQKKVDSLQKEYEDLKNYDPLYKSKQNENVEVPVAIRYYFQAEETKNYELLTGCFAPNFYRYYDNYNPFDWYKFQHECSLVWDQVDEITINVLQVEKIHDNKYHVLTEINHFHTRYEPQKTNTFIETIEFILDDVKRIQAIYKIN